MKINILKPALAVLMLIGTACTANYGEINSNPYEPDQDELEADGYLIGSTLANLAGTVVSTDVNTAQFTDVLLGGPMGGYYSTSGGFQRTIMNFNATDDWTNVFMASDRVIPTLYSNLRTLKKVTDDPIVLAFATINKVAAMHRVTDTYGPIPYSQIGENGQIQVAYDSQEKVYNKMFEELDEAIDILSEHRMDAISPKADYIYGGSAEKWCKLANSLKLRLAMRIVYANPEKARQMAEEAIRNEVGVITSNAENARMTSFGADGNPICVAVNYNTPEGSLTGGDTHVAADIICYMNGYEDPRREKYFLKSQWTGIDYVGMRRSIVIPDLATIGYKYSGVNITLSSPIVWINAAEVAFLKAEAKAVFGFDMGPGTAQEFYNEGVRLSFEQWEVSGADAYLANSTRKPQLYTDPNNGRNSFTEDISDITVAWDESATTEQKQERIITQKWIANWQIGNEAWADYRRTGYPNLMPATEAGNGSFGVVDSKLGARRMPYPSSEYTNNNVNVNNAVSTLLNGSDNMATRVWWDCNPAIK
ncbi:RagB/SusD family nutrient uptake outer membrane protein [uncultured Alistipes sp.]|jgi:hypothetical protein|uniref:RagB/SusD family nutrient uptake outer membrane protein n=1 Tax=uncultured Alistipes sp. TaxID=538949 RepID=UPI0025F20276|nr:RagB/SusD family nutrient uptake outer membrane protein [uncultured Alistipes sp.]